MKVFLHCFSTVSGRRLFRAALAAAVLSVLAAGCGDASRKEYDIRGQVVEVHADQGQVTLAHEAIPGYMDAMTMPFTVKDAWALSALAPGQFVEATLVVTRDRSWIENIRISGSGPVEEPAKLPVMPDPGDVIPNFSLMNQDGREIHIQDFRGRPLLLTFIYTRCPLPDYCPLMSGNFAAIHYKLQSLPQADSVPRLLTVSFDTENDTPSVLKEYAARYMKPLRFDEWEFATGTPEEIQAITGYFGLVFQKESGQITHSLVTALIGPDGRLVRLYLGNQWRPDDIVKDMNLDGNSK